MSWKAYIHSVLWLGKIIHILYIGHYTTGAGSHNLFNWGWRWFYQRWPASWRADLGYFCCCCCQKWLTKINYIDFVNILISLGRYMFFCVSGIDALTAFALCVCSKAQCSRDEDEHCHCIFRANMFVPSTQCWLVHVLYMLQQTEYCCWVFTEL